MGRFKRPPSLGRGRLNLPVMLLVGHFIFLIWVFSLAFFKNFNYESYMSVLRVRTN